MEIQLFKLYHNEQSINHLTTELKTKSRDLDKLEKKKSEIDQQLKSKKQENAKFSREMASVEKKITTKVGTMKHTFTDTSLNVCLIVFLNVWK